MKILFVTLSNLGDVILTLPVFQALYEKHPEAEFSVITSQASKMVFESDSRVKKTYVYDKKAPLAQKWKLLKEIRREGYDLAVDLRRSLFGLFSGAKLRNSYLLPLDKSRHRARRHFHELTTIGRFDFPNKSFLMEKAKTDISELVSKVDFSKPLVLAACGSKSDTKRWEKESYSKLLNRIAEEDGAEIILIGDQAEAELSEVIREGMCQKQKALNLAGKTNFTELTALISKASLVITNDSAPLHLADSLKVPVLAIFGPTDPKKYGPMGKASLVVRKKIFCSPCEKAQCRYQHECMTEISVDEVYKKARLLLNDLTLSKKPKILVTRLDRIGDVMLSMPAIQAIRDTFPDAQICAMTRPSTAELLERHPAVNEVLVYRYEKKGRHSGPIGNLRFIQEIARRKFDIAFILHPSYRSHFVPYFAGIPYRIGFDSKIPFTLTERVPDRRAEGAKHESEYTLDVVRAFKVPIELKNKASFLLFQSDEIYLENTRPLLAVHAGASCDSKKWAKERFVEVSKQAIQLLDCDVVVVGGKEEKDLGSFLKKEIGGRVTDLTGQLSLTELAALLKKSRLLLSNDSGPVHIAAAVGTPTVCIFGRNQAGLSAKRWRALGSKHRVIQKDVGCVICLAHDCTINFECLKAIDSETVFKNVQELWMGS